MYRVITESCKSFDRFPENENLVNFSLLKNLDVPLPFKSFSIKYVFEGAEEYVINGNRYSVTQGHYLLANSFCEGKITIDSKRIVKGICIDIAPGIISEVVANLLRPDSICPDIELDIFFNSADFLENVYWSGSTHLGSSLSALDKVLDTPQLSDHRFTNEFYYTLAENIVRDHIPVYRKFQNTPGIKSVTKKELLRRMEKGKAFIDLCFCATIDIAAVASEACLSEYHFFRLFKAIYGVSPHKYLVHKRLQHAAQMFKKGAVSVSDVADASGFADVSNFSKAFKKYYGILPSNLLSA